MTVNRDEFFREVTLRICSSLDIRVAVKRAFDYLREHFPLDEVYLDIFDIQLGAIRRIAHFAKGAGAPRRVCGKRERLWRLQSVSNTQQRSRQIRLAKTCRLPASRMRGDGICEIIARAGATQSGRRRPIGPLDGEKNMDKETITLRASVIALLGSLPAKQEKNGVDHDSKQMEDSRSCTAEY